MADKRAIIPLERIESRIFFIRGQKVMFDADLAWLYEVETRALVQAVKRNIERFPGDFMFQLTQEEFNFLRSQSVISNPERRGGRRYSRTHDAAGAKKKRPIGFSSEEEN